MRCSNRSALRIGLTVAAVCLAAAAATAVAVTAPDDSDIPGVSLPASPFIGSLTDTTVVGAWDYDDVYRVPLGRNVKFDATMTPPANADFDIYLFSYLTRTLDQAFVPGSGLITAMSELPTGQAETLTFVSDRSSVTTWYLDVAAQYDSSGPYTLSWRMTQLPTPVIEATAPAICGYGASAVITGTARVESPAGTGLRPMSGFAAWVMAKPAGSSSWTKVATTRTDGSGGFSAAVRPARTTQYYIKTQWAYSQEDSSPIGWGAGRAFTVAPKAYLAFGTTPRMVYANTTFSASGVVKPSHSVASTRHVKLIASKWNGTRYVPYKYVWTRSSGTAWAGKIALPKGRWRLGLSAAADSLHASTTATSYRYFTVK